MFNDGMNLKNSIENKGFAHNFYMNLTFKINNKLLCDMY